MNHTEIRDSVAEKTGLGKDQTEKAIRAYLEVVEESLVKDHEARLLTMGTLKVRGRAGRIGRNPKTKENIEIAPTVVVALSSSKGLKERINEKISYEDVAKTTKE